MKVLLIAAAALAFAMWAGTWLGHWADRHAKPIELVNLEEVAR